MKSAAIQTASAPTLSVGRRNHSLLTAPAVAGVAFTTAWVSGLAAWPSNLGIGSSNVKVLDTYRAHHGAAMTDGETEWPGRLFDLINRIDGVKMSALAVTAAAGVGLVRRLGLPRWLGFTAALLAATMIASGVGLVLLNAALAQTVFVSGRLLLVWVTGRGVALARTSGSRAKS